MKSCHLFQDNVRMLSLLVLAIACALPGPLVASDEADDGVVLSKLPQVFLEDLPNPASDANVELGDNKQVISLPTGHTAWRGVWDLGQIKLQGGERFTLTAYVSNELNPSRESAVDMFVLQLYGGELLGFPPDAVEISEMGGSEGVKIVINFALPNETAGKVLSGLWLRFKNPSNTEVHVELRKVAVSRPENALLKMNTDKILRAEPPVSASVKKHNGAMTIFVDGEPITATGWAAICTHNVPDAELQQMVTMTKKPLIRIPFALGDSMLNLYPNSFVAEDQYDFSYLDSQMQRVLAFNPEAQFILMVALDYSKWWAKENPRCVTDKNRGLPDYLSPEWRKFSRDMIRNLVAHIQSQPFSRQVIGYQLYNGSSMDCNFEQPLTTRRALSDFRNFLKTKYHTSSALSAAWGLSGVNLENAGPIGPRSWGDLISSPVTLLIEPRRQRAVADTQEFLGLQYAQVIRNFAQDVKQATHGKLLAGARTGDFMGQNAWQWPIGLPNHTLGPMIAELSKCPDFDFYDIQESYVGRRIGPGVNVPIVPVQGLAADGKLVIIQNDIRTHLSEPNVGYGRTANLEDTIQVQRRVFVNALVGGTSPYLWQQEYHYNDATMLADYRKQDLIFQKAQHVNRATGAEVAFVFDRDCKRFFGFDPVNDAPSRAFSLFDYIKFPWQRMGVPFDMVFLDQLEALPAYKVYVFVHTIAPDAAQRAMIQRVTAKAGNVSVFMWADGLIDDKGAFSEHAMSDLTGIKIRLSLADRDWKLRPSEWLRSKMPGLTSETPLGAQVVDPCEPHGDDNVYSPSFSIVDEEADPLALASDGSIGAAAKRIMGHTAIYTSSGIIGVPILKFALRQAGVFEFTKSEAQSVFNTSFIGVHAYKDEDVEFALPEKQALYEVFSGQALEPNHLHKVSLKKNKTYLFYRGSQQSWERLGQG